MNRGRSPLLAAALTLVGCSATDPLELWNRPVYEFNEILDRALISHVANAYTVITPRPLRTGISNFFDNLTYPNVILNQFLQGKVGKGFGDIGRFVVNSTVGLGGLIDVATHWGLEKHDEDLGQTLGVWGLGEGAYLVLPLVGPLSLRDAPDLVLSRVTSVFFFVDDPRITLPATVLSGIDERARADPALKAIEQAALDRYVFTRESYRQHRLFLIYDGSPPAVEDEPGIIDMEQGQARSLQDPACRPVSEKAVPRAVSQGPRIPHRE
ncbi:MAG: VacJ family lipoprotein [Planctomycetota bacterium]